MASVNKAIIVGNLGADPEVRAFDGKNVCNFSVATSEKWKDKSSGEMQEKTEWHNISVWGAQADTCAKYLKKGSAVFVEGSIETRKYEKDGETKYATNIKGMRVQFLDKKSEGGSTKPPSGNVDANNEIPF